MTAFNRHAFTHHDRTALYARAPRVQPRRGQIDTVRALACLALVSFHVVGATPQSGLDLPYDHALHQINAVLADLRMPLFSFLSGYVFVVLLPQSGASAVAGSWAKDRIIAKARRLLVPLMTVGTLFWLTRAAMGTPQQDLWTIYVLPYAHFWYLQATMLIMVTFIGLIWLTGGQGPRAAVILMIAGFGAWLFLPRAALDIFAAKEAIRLSGFFAAGYLVAHAWPRIEAAITTDMQRRLGLLMLGLALLCGVMTAQGIWVLDPTAKTLLAIVVGLGGSVALFLIRPYHAVLAMLGHYSYAIFLFHVFFTAGLREVLGATAPGLPVLLIWGLLVLAGVIGPMCVQQLLLRHRIGALCGLGLRRRQAEPRTGPVIVTPQARPVIRADRAVLSADANPLL